MACPQKEILQQKCSAAWEAFVDSASKSGLPVDAQGHLRPPSVGEMVAARTLGYYASAGRSFEEPMRLRGEHLKASRELSRHLSLHRC